MPIEHLLPALSVPVPLHAAPDGVYAGADIGLPFPVKIGLGREESLHKERRFHKVSAVILLRERDHLAGAAVEPVGICAVESLGR